MGPPCPFRHGHIIPRAVGLGHICAHDFASTAQHLVRRARGFELNRTMRSSLCEGFHFDCYHQIGSGACALELHMPSATLEKSAGGSTKDGWVPVIDLLTTTNAEPGSIFIRRWCYTEKAHGRCHQHHHRSGLEANRATR